MKMDYNDQETKKMVNREIILLASINHPTIIKIIGFSLQDFKHKDHIAILMKYAANGSLSNILEKIQQGLGPTYYNNTTRQIILIGIARGMKYLHDRNIIHRDLKPGNILLDELFNPLITDFGLSKYFKTGETDIQTQNGGTLIYRAPEVINGMNYDTKADVYSFGILMFEVLTDTFPYPDLINGKMAEFIFNKKVVEENYRPVFSVPVKKPLKDLVEKCWAAAPNERPTFTEIFNKLSIKNENDGDDYLLSDVSMDEFNNYIADVTEITDNIDKLNYQIDKIELENHNLKTKNKQLEKDKKKLKNDKEQLEKDKKHLQAEKVQLEEDKKQSKKDKDNLQKQNDKLKQRIKKLEKDINQFTSKSLTYLDFITYFKFPILCFGLFIEIMIILFAGFKPTSFIIMILIIFISEFYLCCLKNRNYNKIRYIANTLLFVVIIIIILTYSHNNDNYLKLGLIYFAFFNIVMYFYFVPKVIDIKYCIITTASLFFDFIFFFINWNQFNEKEYSNYLYIFSFGSFFLYCISMHLQLSINFLYFIFFFAFVIFYGVLFGVMQNCSDYLYITSSIIMISLAIQYCYTILMKKNYTFITCFSIVEVLLLCLNYYELINEGLFEIFLLGMVINYLFLILNHAYSAFVVANADLIIIIYSIYNLMTNSNLKSSLIFFAFSSLIKFYVCIVQISHNRVISND